MKALLPFLLVMGAVLTSLSPLHGQVCDCLPESQEEVEARAELIVMATVVHVEGVMDSRKEVRARLRVEQVLKGAWQTEEIEVRTPGQTERCGLDFQEHAQWLVCMRKVRLGEWYSDHCDGSKLGSETRSAEINGMTAALDRKNGGARYVMPGFEFVEDLVVRGEGTEAKLFRPNEEFRQKGSPFKEATLFKGDFHHNGFPVQTSVMYRAQAMERAVFERWVPELAGLPPGSAEMKLYKDDLEVTEFLVKPKGSDGSTGAMVSYFKEEGIAVVYFLE